MLAELPDLVFFVLCLVTALPLVPLRWSLLAYLVVSHVVQPTPEFESAVSIGVRNAILAIVLPTALLLRTRFAGLLAAKDTVVAKLWVAFLLYVGIASLWTPYGAPALKQLGYLYCYTALFGVFLYAFSDRRLRMPSIVATALVCSVLLGAVQTFLYGNPFGGASNRFTSFGPAQSYGIYLAVMFGLLAALVRGRRLATSTGLLVGGLVLVALLLNGSRQGMISSALTLAFIALPIQRRPIAALLLPVLLVNALVLGIAGARYVSTPGASGGALGLARAADLTRFATEGFDAVQEIGTSRARFETYEVTLERYRSRPLFDRLFGRGTSSAAELIIDRYIIYRDYDEYTVDANRVVHNELLRGLYEWGVVGAVLLVGVLVSIIVGAIRTASAVRSAESYVLAFQVSLIISMYCLLGNILAAAAAPLGVAVSLTIAGLAQFVLRPTAAPTLREVRVPARAAVTLGPRPVA